jgi:hypothetical protein
MNKPASIAAAAPAPAREDKSTAIEGESHAGDPAR